MKSRRPPYLPPAVLFVTVAAFSGAGTLIATAQNWHNPLFTPPQNNPGQPPGPELFTDYIFEDLPTTQYVNGPVNVGQDPDELGVLYLTGHFGDPYNKSIGIMATDTPATYYPPGKTGVYGYSSQYGVYGFSDALPDGAPYEEFAGLTGSSNDVYHNTLAGLFEGPVLIQNDFSGNYTGSLETAGAVLANKGVICMTPTCAIQNDYWLTGTHTFSGTAIYGTSENDPGIFLRIGDASNAYNAGYASFANTWSGYGIGGYGNIGIHAKAGGDDKAIGLYAYAEGSDPLVISAGLRASSSATFGSPDYDAGAGFNYDFGAGVRACMRNSGGAVLNQNGLWAEAIANPTVSWAGYFAGDGGGGVSNPTTGWSKTFDNSFSGTSPSSAGAMAVIPASLGHVLYVGTGGGEFDKARIVYCNNPAVNDCDDPSDWTISYAPAPAEATVFQGIGSFAYDPVHNTLYAPRGGNVGAGWGEVLKCSLNANGECPLNTWTLSSSFPPDIDRAGGLLYDQAHTVLYAGVRGIIDGTSDIYACAIPDAQVGGCATSDWGSVFQGPERKTFQLTQDAVHDVIYVGLGGDVAGDGDIYRCEPPEGGDGVCSVWTKIFEASDHAVAGAGQFASPANIKSLAYDATNHVLYAGEGGNATGGISGDANVWACRVGTNGLCDLTEWQLVFDGAQAYGGNYYQDVGSLLYDPAAKTVYFGLGYDENELPIDNVELAKRCTPNKDGDKDGLCELGEWVDAFTAAQAHDVSLYLDEQNRYLYAGLTHGTDEGNVFRYPLPPDRENDGDVFVAGTTLLGGQPDTAFDTDGIADTTSYEKVRSLAVDSQYLYGMGDTDEWRIEKRSKTTGALCTGGACGAGQDFGTGGRVEVPGIDGYGHDIAIDGNALYTVGVDESQKNSITTVDSADMVGQHVSMAIGADNYPIIAYFDDTNNDLKVAKCLNPTCSDYHTITLVDGTGNDVGQYTSIAIGADTFPVIAYYTLASGNLKVAKCINQACTGAATITTVDGSANDVGKYASIAIGTDTFPVITYFDDTADDLKVAKCINQTCTGVSTITLVDGTGNDVGQYTSIAIGADTFPVIAYSTGSSLNLKVAKCANQACTGAATITAVDGSANDVGKYASIAIGADTFPVIAYYDATNTNLMVAKCINQACTGSSTINAVFTADSVGTGTDIVISHNDLPAISYYDATNHNLKVLRCGDVSCATVNTNSVITANGEWEGDFTAIAMRANDDYPVIAYHNITHDDLKVAKCWSWGCSDSEALSWHIEKRNLTNGALVTAFGGDGDIDFSDIGTSAGTAYTIAVHNGYLYITGEGSSDARFRIEKRNATTGLLCNSTNCPGAAFGPGAADRNGIIETGTNLYVTPYTLLGRGIALDTTNNLFYVSSGKVQGAASDQGIIHKFNMLNGDPCTGVGVCDGATFGTLGIQSLAVNTEIRDLLVANNHLYVGGFTNLASDELFIEKRRLDTGAICDGGAGCGSGVFGVNGAVKVTPTGGGQTNALVAGNGYLYSATWQNVNGGDGDWLIEKRTLGSGALDTDFGNNGAAVAAGSGSEPEAITADFTGLYVAGDNDSAQWRVAKFTVERTPLLRIGNTTLTKEALRGLLCKAYLTNSLLYVQYMAYCD